jgi:hypothetical protein
MNKKAFDSASTYDSSLEKGVCDDWIAFFGDIAEAHESDIIARIVHTAFALVSARHGQRKIDVITPSFPCLEVSKYGPSSNSVHR